VKIVREIDRRFHISFL